jgi:two-component system phosphate regulon response regulator PhoB
MNLVGRNASRNTTNPCITIIEGDIALAFALSHNLKTEGYVVESVDRGDEAVRKLADAPPDLVILDWMLPGMSGPEICTRLRAEDATRMLPIIMLSARARNSCACAALAPGRTISSSSPSRCAS